MNKKYIIKEIKDYTDEELINLVKAKARRVGVTYNFSPVFEELERRRISSQNCKEIK